MPCPHCYVGLCKKHKLQDHGEREKKLLASRQVLQKKMIEESVKPHAARILAQGKGTSEKELDKYREEMERDREEAMKRKSKYTEEEIEMMQKSGLRGDVIMNMIKASKSSRDKDKDKAKKKKKKKEKKERKERKREKKERKERKREKKDRKKKKERKRKRESESEDGSEDSSSDSSSSGSEGETDASVSGASASGGERRKRGRGSDRESGAEEEGRGKDKVAKTMETIVEEPSNGHAKANGDAGEGVMA